MFSGFFVFSKSGGLKPEKLVHTDFSKVIFQGHFQNAFERSGRRHLYLHRIPLFRNASFTSELLVIVRTVRIVRIVSIML